MRKIQRAFIIVAIIVIFAHLGRLVMAGGLSAIVTPHSDQKKYFDEYMQRFEEDSATAMDQVPPKFDHDGRLVSSTRTLNFEDKINLRDVIKSKMQQPFSEAVKKSQIEYFFKSGVIIEKKLAALSGPLQNATLSNSPWSGDYWATYRGGVGVRYADPGFPFSADFQDYYSAYQKFLPLNYENAEALNNLSPAEKYDILVGDEAFSMTKWTYEDANETYRGNNNKVESWFGICHGWAPAAFMLPRPEKVVEYKIENFQGKNFTLKLYPDDLKAMASLLWANTTLETNFLGGRCDTKDPKKDRSGRILDEDCFDVNPGAWHMAVLNHLGKTQMSFVFDASYDYEVWNQPVSGYEVSYFNPETKKTVESLDQATIPLEHFSKDKFKSFRSNKTKYVVGVNMLLTYIVESGASHKEINTPQDDNLRMVHYIYDLELDANGTIIGGEWYQNVHPDFLWTPDKDAHAISVADRSLRGSWAGNIKVPDEWTKSATFASGYGQPLAKVIEGMLQRAKLTQQ